MTKSTKHIHKRISLWRSMEIILFVGMALLGLWALLGMLFLILQNLNSLHPYIPENAGWLERALNYIVYGACYIVPPLTVFAAAKAILKQDQRRWAILTAICAAIFGGGAILAGVAIGHHYAAESGQVLSWLPGTLAIISAALVSALPFIIISFFRHKRKTR